MTGFSIELELPINYYTGLEAIDLCRKYGLEECARIRTRGSTTFKIDDESFIRAWFPSNATHMVRTVQLEWLSPPEVCIHSGDIDIAASAVFTVARVKELFIRAEFAKVVAGLPE